MCTERAAAVESWLLTAAPDSAQARAEWAASGVTRIRCGEVFSAVRIPVELVYAAAQAREPGVVDGYLAGALQGGPVFLDTYWQHFYALVRPDAWARWEARDAEGMGHGVELEVPHPSRTRCEAGRAYWCVPVDAPGQLCETNAVTQLLDVALLRLVGEGADR